jgi:hypothetical protein
MLFYEDGENGENGGYFLKLFSMVFFIIFLPENFAFFWGIEFLSETPHFPHF